VSGYPFALALAVATLLLLLWLLRTHRLREKYAFLWVGLAVGICVLGAFPRFLFVLASFLGVKTPLTCCSPDRPSSCSSSRSSSALRCPGSRRRPGHLSAEVSRLEEETRTLAESIALLQSRVEELEKERKQ